MPLFAFEIKSRKIYLFYIISLNPCWLLLAKEERHRKGPTVHGSHLAPYLSFSAHWASLPGPRPISISPASLFTGNRNIPPALWGEAELMRGGSSYSLPDPSLPLVLFSTASHNFSHSLWHCSVCTTPPCLLAFCLSWSLRVIDPLPRVPCLLLTHTTWLTFNITPSVNLPWPCSNLD